MAPRQQMVQCQQQNRIPSIFEEEEEGKYHAV